MKKKVLKLAIILILVLMSSYLLISLISKDYWTLKSCEDECIHRGFNVGVCNWPSESENLDAIGECYIKNSKHCGNRNQCNCYCENTKNPENEEKYECDVLNNYIWDKTIGACINEQEIDLDSEKQAAKIAVNYADSKGYDFLIVNKIVLLKCPGCFIVYLSSEEQELKIDISNWNPSLQIINYCSENIGEEVACIALYQPVWGILLNKLSVIFVLPVLIQQRNII